MSFRGWDLRDWRLPGGGPRRLTTRLLLALINHLGPDSPLWAERNGEGFTHSQLVAMEAVPLLTGGLHPRHPYSAFRKQQKQAKRAQERAEHYARQKAAQEAALEARKATAAEGPGRRW